MPPGSTLYARGVWIVWADRYCMMIKLSNTDASGNVMLDDVGNDDEGVLWLRGHGDAVDEKKRKALEVARALMPRA